MEILMIVGGLILTVVLVFVYRALYRVREGEVVIIERLGKYERTLPAGLHIVVPFLEQARVSQWVFVQEVSDGRYYRVTKQIMRLDVRETMYDFPRQQVITRDNLVMEVSALLYYQIIDPRAAVYEVANLPEAIERLAHSTLRNVIGELDLDETLISRDRINHRLQEILDEATHQWGVKVNRVELQEVTPPKDIRHAMEKQMRAERERRAVIKEAEGIKAAAILQAEGQQQSQVLAAEGAAEAKLIAARAEAEARITVLTAEAKALEQLQQRIPAAQSTQYLITQQYITALSRLADGKDSKVMIVPYEVAGLSSLVAQMTAILPGAVQQPERRGLGMHEGAAHEGAAHASVAHKSSPHGSDVK